MGARVRLSDIVQGMEMQFDDTQSYLHRPTGRIITVTRDALAAAENDDEEWVSPEELDDARAILAGKDDCLPLPDRFEIDEYRMMERFAISLTNSSERDAARAALGGRGAFRHFKDTMYRLGLQKSWFAFRDQCYRDLAREWCEANGVEFEPS